MSVEAGDRNNSLPFLALVISFLDVFKELIADENLDGRVVFPPLMRWKLYQVATIPLLSQDLEHFKKYLEITSTKNGEG